MTKPRKPRRRRRLLAAALVLAALVLFFLWSQNDLTTRTIEVAAPRLPAAFDGLRISLVSDVHGKEFGTDSARLLAAVAEQEPDLIAITGDLVDEAAHLDLVEPLARVLTSLGVRRGMVVYGQDKLDELSLSAPTSVCEFKDGWYKTYTIQRPFVQAYLKNTKDTRVQAYVEFLKTDEAQKMILDAGLVPQKFW